jgi:hypothetical protein
MHAWYILNALNSRLCIDAHPGGVWLIIISLAQLTLYCHIVDCVLFLFVLF